MSLTRRERREKVRRDTGTQTQVWRQLPKRLVSLTMAVLVASAITFAVMRYYYSGFVPPSAQRVTTVHDGLTLGRLLEMTPWELERVDLAEMNLLCAKGLPGMADFDMKASLALLAQWTDRVDTETRRNWHRYKDNPAEYHHSEIEYRMGMLVTVLQQDFGVHYNPDLISFSQPGQRGPEIEKAFYGNPGNVFLTEILSARRAGTCASMPVLYAAVARRLGYPVTLSNAKEHLFVRWNRPGLSHVNIEGAGRGFTMRGDDDFKKWPYTITDTELQAGQYLQSLTPSEELGVFLFTRGGVLLHHHQPAGALEAFAQAARLWPKGREWRAGIALAAMQLAPREFQMAQPINLPSGNPVHAEAGRTLQPPGLFAPNVPSPFSQMPSPSLPQPATFPSSPALREMEFINQLSRPNR